MATPPTPPSNPPTPPRGPDNDPIKKRQSNSVTPEGERLGPNSTPASAPQSPRQGPDPIEARRGLPGGNSPGKEPKSLDKEGAGDKGNKSGPTPGKSGKKSKGAQAFDRARDMSQALGKKGGGGGNVPLPGKAGELANKAKKMADSDPMSSVNRALEAARSKGAADNRAKQLARFMGTAGVETLSQAAQALGVPVPVARVIILGILTVGISGLAVLLIAVGGLVLENQVDFRANSDVADAAYVPAQWEPLFEDAAAKYDVPYAVLVGLAKTQTDLGSGENVDQIDRNPGKPDSTTLAIKPTTAAGIHVNVFGDGAIANVNSSLNSKLGVNSDVVTYTPVNTMADAIAAYLAGQSNGSGAQVSVIAVGNPDTSGIDMVALNAAVPPLGNVILVTSSANNAGAYNGALSDAAKQYDNITVVDWNSYASSHSDATDSAGVVSSTGVDEWTSEVSAAVTTAAGNAPQTSTGVAQPKNVSIWPKEVPDIGSKSDPKTGLGPFLIKPSAARADNIDAQDVKTSIYYIGKQLGSIRDEMKTEGYTVPDQEKSTPEEGDAFWSEAVNRLPVVNRFGSTNCSLPTPLPDNSTLIQTLFRCQLTQEDNLHVVTSVDAKGNYTYAEPTAAESQVIDDALNVSYSFSQWGVAACDPNSSQPQGVFPLPKSVANRCDPVTNITAAAKMVSDGFNNTPGAAKSLSSGPYSALWGGWSTMPTALGTANLVGQYGPYKSAAVSTACVDAVDAWLPNTIASMPYFVATPATGDPVRDQIINVLKTDPNSPRAASCGGLSDDEWDHLIGEEAGNLSASDEDPTADATSGTTTTTVAAGTPQVTQGDVAMRAVSDIYTQQSRTPVVGTDPLIPRLSTVYLVVNYPALPAATASNPTDLGQQVLAASLEYGGVIEGDPRVGQAQTVGTGVTPDAASISAALGIDQTVAQAYLHAAELSSTLNKPGCVVDWTIPAGIGYAESRHAAAYLPISANGDLAKKVVGIALDGTHGTEKQLNNLTPQERPLYGIDPNDPWNHAVGPTQFLITTWAKEGMDGNGDGVRDPFNMFDAAFSTVNYLCNISGDLQTDAGLRTAILGYNHSNDYVNEVMGQIAKYRALGLNGVTTAATGPSAQGNAAVAAAEKELGIPYSWGGGSVNGPTTGIQQGASTVGFDCSALVQFAWHAAGVSIPRTTGPQYSSLPHVPLDQMIPGDLIFYQENGAIAHVGMYIGPNQMIEAPHTGLDVRLSDWHRSNIVGAARP